MRIRGGAGAGLAAAVALAALALVATVALNAAAAGTGSTWRVDDGAVPAGDGSAATPFTTIAQALAVAQPGDTVRVGPGTYEGFTTVRSGTADGQIVIRGRLDAFGQPLARIVGTGDERLVNVHHDHITLRRLDISSGDINVWVGSPVADDETTGVRILESAIHDANGECVRLKYFAVANTIADNRIASCGLTGFDLAADSKNGEGIYIGTAPEQLERNPTADPDASNGNRVRGNVITTKAECVEMKEAASFNVIAENTCSGTRDPDGAGFSSRGDHNLFIGNSSTENRGDGIRLGGDERGQGIGNDVIDNVLADNRGYGLDVQKKPQGEVCGNTVTGNRKGDTNGGYEPAAPC